MEIDEGSLRSMVAVIDAAISTVRDKFTWRQIAISQLGDNADEVFRRAQTHPLILRESEIELAELKQTRKQFALMLEKALKGEPVQSPLDRVN
jgi:hypothetical protein